MAHFDGRDDFELAARELPGEDVADLVLPDTSLEPVSDRLEHQRAELKVMEAVDDYYQKLANMGYEIVKKSPYAKFAIGADGLLYFGAKRVVSKDKNKIGRPLENLSKEVQTDLGIRPIPLPPEAAAKLKDVEQVATNVENIPMQDLSQASPKVSQAIRALMDAETQIWKASSADFPLRELQGLDKMMASMSANLVQAEAKRSALVQENMVIKQQIERRTQKIAEAIDEEGRKFQEDEKDRLEAEYKQNLEEIATWDTEIAGRRSRVRDQISRIKDTVLKMLHEDTTLGERIRTLFREQGLTIATILTAIGMTISTIVLAITGGGSAAVAPTPPPSDKSGVKDWIKQRLQDLGRLLGKLTEKAAAALPGIIGSIVTWLLSTAQKAVGWLAENLWALVVAIVGMVYLTARGYMTMKLATSKPKKS